MRHSPANPKQYLPETGHPHGRRGAIAPLMALLLPVIILVCGMAVNIAYMQLSSTQLQVAVDASSRAGGRALSEFQNIDTAMQYAVNAAAANSVIGKSVVLDSTESSGEIVFGTNGRANNGFGRYTFTPQDRQAIRNKSAKATAMRITGKRTVGSASGPVELLFFGFGPFGNFQPVANSTATQVDRDIALVVDRSGSMVESIRDYTQYYYTETYYDSRGRKKTRNVWTDSDMEDEYNLYNTQLKNFNNNNGPAPDASRWAALGSGVQQFLNVLEGTDQEEQVSLCSYSSSATRNCSLTKTFSTVTTKLNSLRPSGNTAIGSGLSKGAEAVRISPSRPYAAKTIIILTDGLQNSGTDPVTVATSTMNSQNVVIHTITFSDDADIDRMEQVADIGKGKHYHAVNGQDLIDIFEEIANNLPTIITE